MNRPPRGSKPAVLTAFVALLGLIGAQRCHGHSMRRTSTTSPISPLACRAIVALLASAVAAGAASISTATIRPFPSLRTTYSTPAHTPSGVAVACTAPKPTLAISPAAIARSAPLAASLAALSSAPAVEPTVASTPATVAKPTHPTTHPTHVPLALSSASITAHPTSRTAPSAAAPTRSPAAPAVPSTATPLASPASRPSGFSSSSNAANQPALATALASTARFLLQPVELCGDIVAETTLLANVTYFIRCAVFVSNGATLYIEPGVTLLAAAAEPPNITTYFAIDRNADGISPEEFLYFLERRGESRGVVASLFSSLDTDASCSIDLTEWTAGLVGATPSLTVASLRVWPALVVERGGRIIAEGTPAAPITMGSNLTTGEEVWGGLLVMGSAPVRGPCVSLCSTTAPYPYGGNLSDDSSGTLRYVRVWRSHFGITMVGVGAQTVVDECEVVLSATDGFTLRGGSVNVAHLSSLVAAEAAIRISGGYHGHAQFLFVALGHNGTDGIVVDSPASPSCSIGNIPNATPPQLISITVIGGGAGGRVGSLLRIGAGSAASVDGALLLYGTAVGVQVCGSLNLTDPSFAAWSNSSSGAAYAFVDSATIVHSTNITLSDLCPSGAAPLPSLSTVAPGLSALSPDCLDLACLQSSFFDPLPLARGAACAHTPAAAISASTFFTAVECSGAFGFTDPQSNWLAGWSSLFPDALGKDAFHAISIVVQPGSSTFKLDTSSLATSPFNAAALSGRRLQTTTAPDPIYNLTQCADVFFSGVGSAVWLRFTATDTEVLVVSTCAQFPDSGFDTDLAVFELTGGPELRSLDQLKQLNCNGDDYGLQGCQPGYSRLLFDARAGVTYFVAIGGYGGALGSNVTLSIEASTPPSPPWAPQPPSPPPPMVEATGLQQDIDSGPDTPFAITLDGVNELNQSIIIPAPKQVVLRGANSSEPAVVKGRGTRLFRVLPGAQLYLSNLILQDGVATAECGGAVYVEGDGVLVSQYVRFENNSAARGGAVCMQSNGLLNLSAVNMSGNRALEVLLGHDIYLGRPTRPFPQANFEGVLLSADNGDGGSAIVREGLWASATCPLETAADSLFLPTSSVAFSRTAPYSSCTATRLSGGVYANKVYGRTCNCNGDAAPSEHATPELRALAPYGYSSVDDLLGTSSQPPVCELLPLSDAQEIYLATDLGIFELIKTPAESQSELINLTMLIQGQGLSLATDQHRWEVSSALGTGPRSVRACTGRAAPTDLVVVDGSSCFLQSDGTMQIFDLNASGANVSGWPIRVLESSAQLEDITQNRLVNIPVQINSAGLRETEEDSPYSQTFMIDIVLDTQIEHQRNIYVTVSAEAVASTSTFVPPSPPPTLPQPTQSSCTCTNQCALGARDGVCDDGGPASDYSACTLGSDCADCGPRAGPAAAFYANASSSGLLLQLQTQLLTSQRDECISPIYKDYLCGESTADGDCSRIGFGVHRYSGSSGADTFTGESFCRTTDSGDWVPSDYTFNYWRLDPSEHSTCAATSIATALAASVTASTAKCATATPFNASLQAPVLAPTTLGSACATASTASTLKPAEPATLSSTSIPSTPISALAKLPTSPSPPPVNSASSLNPSSSSTPIDSSAPSVTISLTSTLCSALSTACVPPTLSSSLSPTSLYPTWPPTAVSPTLAST
ncbi:hypothetical protein AB1Y20_018376 [Prymnesium parvum]|uniref:Phosphoinositide phospholipase C n=1 Tax=Prymnesium parvum TaxID=97485 RepID=A0AB34JPQ5_PRYPA